jgi:glycerol-3-phosphate acyltransferase PlsY
MTAHLLLVLLGAFLLGSLPTAYLVAQAFAGVDIRAVGDGNPGAKNVYQSVGPLAGVLVAAVDIAKGAAAVGLAQSLGETGGVVRAVGLAAVLGHDFSPFLRFRGGQGMAAILGVFGILYPWELAGCLALGALAFLVTRNWDLSCAVAFVAFAGSLWFTGHTVAEALYPFVLLPTIGLKKAIQVWQARHATNGLAR